MPEKLPEKLDIGIHILTLKHRKAWLNSTSAISHIFMWDSWRNKLTSKRSLILVFLGQKCFQLGVNPQVTVVWRANVLYCLHQIFRNGTILIGKNHKDKKFRLYGLNMHKLYTLLKHQNSFSMKTRPLSGI